MSRAFVPIMLLIAIVVPHVSAVNVTINGNDVGRTFDGIGLTSANGSTEMLLDYQEPYQSDILDLLFKPKFGMSIQHIKAEMGCGRNTTCGSEAPHAVTEAENANPVPRTYEFWLFNEAKKRNPAIVTEALAWGYPDWCGWMTQKTADYCASYVKSLKNAYGINLDYMSCAVNEGEYDRNWIVNTLRPTLNREGYSSVKLSGPDMAYERQWHIFDLWPQDTALLNAVDVVSGHFDWDNRSPGWAPTDKAKSSGRTLWSTEMHNGWLTGWNTALYMARGHNANYVYHKITHSNTWYVLDAMPAQVAVYKYAGAIQADQPWSGWYQVNPYTWAIAHTTQFTEVGWKYLDGACGAFGSDSNGTYVTLRDPNSSNWSMIIATEAATSISATITGGLSTGTLCVWKSDANAQFVQQASISPVNGAFTISLTANSIYTVSTTTGQQKGFRTIPQSKPFPLPVIEGYESYAIGSVNPRFHSDQLGTWEVCARPDGGKCLHQIIPVNANGGTANTVIGDGSMPDDYEMSADVLIDSGNVVVGGRWADWGKLALALIKIPPASAHENTPADFSRYL